MSDQLDRWVRLVASLGRNDAYAEKTPSGYSAVKSKLSPIVIERHLSGECPVGMYLSSGTLTRLAVFDLDDHGGEGDWQTMASTAKRILDEAAKQGLVGIPHRSGGGRGIHLFFHWASPQSSRDVRRLMSIILESVGLKSGTTGVSAGTVEVFPKQDAVAPGGLGSLIALPGARASVPLDRETLDPRSWSDFDPDKEALRLSRPVPPFVEEEASTGKCGRLPGDEAEAEAALQYIPADDYGDWVRIGLALASSFGDAGYPLFEQWSRKSAKFDQKACEQRWKSFKPNGSLTIGTVFHLAREKGWNGPSDPIIREMNAQYGILTHGRTTEILLKGNRGRLEDAYLGKAQFQDRLAGETFEQTMPDGSSKRVSKAEYWLRHRRASHYTGLVFDPDRPPGDNGEVWNTWRGFAVEPEPGDWSLLKDHIFENICRRDPEQRDWLLNWMALGVQRPGLVIGTAPVLIGFPGTGKGILAHAYGRLWGEHYIPITHAEHVMGRFAGHLFSRRFVFIDEGTFGGNRKDAGVIKTRLTDPEIVLERKGVDAIRMANKMIYMIASNEASVVPADKGDRRWMVIEVGDKRREDHDYFAAIAAQMDEGGYAAMLHELLARDISRGPNPRRTIKTEGLFEQMLLAQTPDIRYLHGLLDEGRLPQNVVAGACVTTIRALVADLHRQHRDGFRVTEVGFGRLLNRVFPTIRRLTAGGVFLAGSSETGTIKERSTAYMFPPLPEARAAFARHVNMPVPWSEVDQWQLDPDADDDPNGVL
jgi:hypothetical protein